jgi:hypothetical protein
LLASHIPAIRGLGGLDPKVSPGNTTIVPETLFGCGFAVESIAKLLMIEQIP